jgi:tRNA(Ile2) C34 agmatinyltransferase TiaS
MYENYEKKLASMTVYCANCGEKMEMIGVDGGDGVKFHCNKCHTIKIVKD